MGASPDYTQIRIPHVLLGIYRIQALQLNKGNFDEKIYTTFIYCFQVFQIRITVYSIIYDSGKIAIYINHERSFQKSNGVNKGTNSHKE